MALTFTDYTSNAIVRGLLGVAEAEIPDDIFTTLTPSFLLDITIDLEELNPTIPTTFETIKALMSPTVTASAAQQRFYSIVQRYTGYVVANKISNGAVAMFAPIQIQDGKAQQVREDDPYTQLREAIAASITLWRKRLATALKALDATQTITLSSPVLVGSAGLGTDPVTGA